jgi:hypothetical protein
LDLGIFTLACFVFALLALDIAALLFGVDSRRDHDDWPNW